METCASLLTDFRKIMFQDADGISVKVMHKSLLAIDRSKREDPRSLMVDSLASGATEHFGGVSANCLAI